MTNTRPRGLRIWYSIFQGLFYKIFSSIFDLLKSEVLRISFFFSSTHCKDNEPKIGNKKKYPQKWNRAVSYPVPTFMYCICARFKYYNRTAYFAAAKYSKWTDRENIQIVHRYMNVDIGSEAAKFHFLFAVLTRNGGILLMVTFTSGILGLKDIGNLIKKTANI